MSSHSPKLKQTPPGLSDRASDIILVVLCLAILLVVAYPLYYVLVASFSDPYDVYAGKTFLLPSQFSFKGYAAVFSDDSILTGYANSIWYTVIGTIFSVAMIYMTAYPLSNPDLPGRKFFNIFFVITMYFGGGLIPTYLIVKNTGLINTTWAMFLPGGVAVSNMIIARNFFETSIPKELKEACEIDGASKLRMFFSIIIPLSKPIMAVMVVFSMVAYRAALEYFHNWFAEGLIDQEAFSQTDTQYMAKCAQGNVGVATWWYIEELMGEHAEDYVFLPVLEGPDGSYNVTVRDGGGINSGNLSITSACESPINLLKFYDQWYAPENVMQLQYGPIDVYFTSQDENGLWQSITDEEAQEKFGKSAGEVKSEYEVYGPKLILSDYYANTFEMEPRAVDRLTDLYDYWMPFVKDTTAYPIDCVYTQDELDTIDKYRVDFENFVSEQEALWLRDGGITDESWNAYKEALNSYGLEELLQTYQSAYDRYVQVSGDASADAQSAA